MDAELISDHTTFNPYTFKITVASHEDHRALYRIFEMTNKEFHKVLQTIEPSNNCKSPRDDYDWDSTVFNVIESQHAEQELE